MYNLFDYDLLNEKEILWISDDWNPSDEKKSFKRKFNKLYCVYLNFELWQIVSDLSFEAF